MKLSSRDKLIIAIALVIVGAVAATVLLVVPQFRRIGELNAKIVKADQDIQMAGSLLARRQSAKQEAARTEAQILRLQNQVPEVPELPAFIIELQDVANLSGLDFAQLTPSQTAAREGYSALPVNVSVGGTWSDIIDFLERLPKMTRAVRVTDFSVTPIVETQESTTTTGPQKTTVALSIEAYVASTPTGGQ